MKKLIINIPNITIDNLRNIKYSLTAKLVKKYYRYIYLNSIYIENRVDIDCVKTYYLMQADLFYNFFNEHIDSTYVINDCNNTIRLKNELAKYIKNTASEKNLNINSFNLYISIAFFSIAFFSIVFFLSLT